MALPRTLLRLVLGRRLPRFQGRIATPGAPGKVTIRRDRFSVPIIDALDDASAAYALGFCHGQDRSFQIDFLVRAARGRLSEIVGPDALPVDRLVRRMGLGRAADAQHHALDDEMRVQFDSYALGVSDARTHGARRKAHEFSLLRADPLPFTGADSLAIGKLSALGLAGNWEMELARLRMLEADGPDSVSDLDPPYADWHPASSTPGVAAGPAIAGLTEDLAAFAAVVTTPGGGSNNWALAGWRTATGRPLVANDPHLGPELPNQWYLARVRTPEWSMAGGTICGAPGFPSGHNGFAAWGVTNGFIDQTDLFVEEVGPDGRSVRQGAEFVPCEVLEERIAVKGGDDVVEQVLITPRGPIVSPVSEEQTHALSMSATWLASDPARGPLALARIRGFDDLRRECAAWPQASLNIVYADETGTVGYQMIGATPRRRRGFGTLPQAGWEPEAGWEDELVPFDELPSTLNPETGYVASANNKPAADGDGPFLGADWMEGYRVARVSEALAERTDWKIEDSAWLQTDFNSLPWRELRDFLLALPATGSAGRGLELLRDWDGEVAPDSSAASVFELFLAEASVRVARARAPRATEWALGRTPNAILPYSIFALRRVSHLVRLVRERPDGWFEHSWEDEMAAALAAAVERLEAEHGPDPAAWRWGTVRPLSFKHPLGAKGGPLAKIFDRGPYPWGGDTNTPAQASCAPEAPTANPLYLGTLRTSIDVGEWDESRFVLAGGQSGNPLSPHYDDQLELWLRREGVAVAWSDEAAERVTVHTLEIVPE